MTDSDIKKLAKVVQLVVDKQMDGLKDEFRKIVRSEIEYALEKNGGAPQQQAPKVMNDNIPEEKMNEIRNATGGKKYKDPKEMIAKMRKMNEQKLDPNRDVFVDENDREVDLSENTKVDTLKNRDYSALIE